MTLYYICIFVIISPLMRTKPFSWTNLNSFHAKIICIKFDWIWSAGFVENDFFNTTLCNILKSIFAPYDPKGEISNLSVAFLFVCLQPPEQFFQLSGGCHHYQWQGCKFRPMLGAQGLWAGRDLYLATPTVTRDLESYGLIRKTSTHIPHWDSNPRLKDHQIFEPDALTTAPCEWLLSFAFLKLNPLWRGPGPVFEETWNPFI
jgi:hypothetical protein